jgi:hypothetical protein
LKSFDEFLEKRFADSRRKAYYLMTTHEHLTRVPKPQYERWVGQRRESSSSLRERTEPGSLVHPECTRQRNCRGKNSGGRRAAPDRERNRAWEILYFLFQGLQEPVTGG